MNKKDQAAERLREMIVSGRLRPGEKLKSGVELAADFGVAHLTMRRALRELELSGDIRIVHGRGIFVAERHAGKRKFLLVRPEIVENAAPTQYLLPYFLQRCNELGVEVDEADLIFLRHSPVSGTVRQLKDNQYSGALLACSGYWGTEPELQILRKLDIPVLIPRGTATDAAVTGFGVLRSDDCKAWECGMAYLKECGIRKVALLLAEPRPLIPQIRGFTVEEHLELLQKYGWSGERDMIAFVNVRNPSELFGQVEQALRDLLNRPEPPEAVYCFSDFVALYVYLTAQKMRLRIPEDLSVMGFCSYPGGKLLSPPLATVDCDYASAGKMAAEMLCDPEKWYFEDERKKEFIVPHKVKKRASVANKKPLRRFMTKTHNNFSLEVSGN